MCGDILNADGVLSVILGLSEEVDCSQPRNFSLSMDPNAHCVYKSLLLSPFTSNSIYFAVSQLFLTNNINLPSTFRSAAVSSYAVCWHTFKCTLRGVARTYSVIHRSVVVRMA